MPNYNIYEKDNINENIQIGDIVSINPITNKVKLAYNCFNKKDKLVIGVCIKIENNTIYAANKGIVDVNTIGVICLGDKLTSCTTPGKCRALKYDTLEEKQFDTRSIGKVIGLYNVYDKAKVLLDIE